MAAIGLLSLALGLAPAPALAVGHAADTTLAAHCGLRHTSLAFVKITSASAAFDHWLYVPWKKGAFDQGVPRRARGLATAAGNVLGYVQIARGAALHLTTCAPARAIGRRLDLASSDLLALQAVTVRTSDADVRLHITRAQHTFATVEKDERSL
jgi:hypothetical protein